MSTNPDHVEQLAAILREVDGGHSKGAAALAQAILGHPGSAWHPPDNLAQSEGEGPTDDQLLRTYGLAKRNHFYDGPEDDWPKRAERAATVHGLRAVLAWWGRTAPAQPEGEARLYDLISKLLRPAYEPGDGTADDAQQVSEAWWHPIFGSDSLQIVIDNARELLACRGRPAPPAPKTTQPIQGDFNG